jgi:ABC-type sugar transport system substrate-binding protein
LVCAVMHQTLSKKLVSKARDMGKRLFSVGADQARMGALQAQQIRRLLSCRPRNERKIVYVLGPDHSTASRLRIAGAVEPLLESDIAVEATHAEWSGNRAAEALSEWQAAGGKIDSLGAIAAQNDQIAHVAKKWLIDKGQGHVPVVGMDGTDALGKQLVNNGTLTATVEQPLGVAEAFDVYRMLLTGELSLEQLLDDPNRRLPPTPYPDIEHLNPL